MKLFLILLTASFAISADVIRILPLGDSITAGLEYPWRFRLQEKLHQNGIRTVFIGSVCNKCKGNDETTFCFACHGTPPLGVNLSHEGHWGLSLEEALQGHPRVVHPTTNGTVAEWISHLNFDVVLLHLGTNDLFRSSEEEVVTNLGTVVHIILRRNPHAVIFLAKIIPVSAEWLRVRESLHVEAKIVNLNRMIGEYFQGEVFAPHVVVVDQYSGFDAAADTVDGVHPNDTGNQKISNVWLNALLSYSSESDSSRDL